jgi:hypothetical protein
VVPKTACAVYLPAKTSTVPKDRLALAPPGLTKISSHEVLPHCHGNQVRGNGKTKGVNKNWLPWQMAKQRGSSKIGCCGRWPPQTFQDYFSFQLGRILTILQVYFGNNNDCTEKGRASW